MELVRKLVIEQVVGGHDDHLGAELEGLGDGHSGLDPIGSGFIAGGGDDAPDLLSAIDNIDKLLFEIFLMVTIKYWCDKGPAVVIHQSDMGTLAAEDLQIAASAYSDRFALECRIDRALGGDKKAVDIDMDEHLTPLTLSGVP